MTCWRFALCLAIFAALCVACGEPSAPTALDVRVTSDMGVPAELDRLSIAVAGQDVERDPEADLRAKRLPRTLRLLHTGGPLGPVRISVKGWRGTTLAVEHVEMAYFEAGQAIPLNVVLGRDCMNVFCADEQTCERGTCQALTPTGDAGLDAAVAADAGGPSDGGARDASADAGAPEAAVVDAGDGSTATLDGSLADAAVLDASAPDAALPDAGAVPTCTITLPVAGDSYQVGVALSLAGSCNDPETGALSQGITWTSTRDGTLANTATGSAALRTQGQHTLSLCARDPRAPALTGCAAVTVQASQNPQPSVSIVSITQNGSSNQPYRAGTPITFVGSGTGAGVTLTFSDDVEGPLGSGESVTLAAPRTGRHTVTLLARDRSGVQRSTSRTYTVVASGETALVTSFNQVNRTLNTAGDPAVRMIASDAALRVYLPTSAGDLLRLDGANLAALPSVAINRVAMRTLPIDAQLDAADRLAYFATQDGLSVCNFEATGGVAAPCNGFTRGSLTNSYLLSVLRMRGSSGAESLLLGSTDGLLVADTLTGSARGTLLLRGRLVNDLLSAQGLAYIATDRGLYTLAQGSGTPARITADGLTATQQTSLALGTDGTLWVGTGAGLVRFNPVTSQSTLYTSAQTLGSIQVRSVAVSRETIGGALRDIVWLGTAAGVARLDTATELVTRFTTSDGLPSNDVQVVHVLSNGHKLFGTASGLAHYIGF
jgi:hypothetical protein